MQPLFAQDPLEALHLALRARWLDVPMTVVAVACEPWALALIAIALYSWLEREVLGVLKVVLPLVVALVLAGAIAVATQHAGASPRPAWAGEGAGGLVRRLLPGGPMLTLATFAAYSLLAYGRRARGVLVLVLLGGLARAWAGPHWAAELVAGGLAGAALGVAAYAGALRLAPRGHLAALRAGRRAAAPAPDAGAGPPLP